MVIRLDERAGDTEAAYDLAVTTHRFSKRAQDVVDDKLSLSAALMRSGEVDEARRMLAQAESELRNEEAELMRQVEELSSYRSLHGRRVVLVERDGPTRSSLMRTLAVAAASSAVVALATMGGAVIGLFGERPEIDRIRVTPTIDASDVEGTRTFSQTGTSRGVTVRINGVRVVLTRSEWRALKRIQRTGDDRALYDLLGVIAPELTASAGTVGEVIEAIGNQIGDGVGRVEGSADASDDASDEGSGGGEGTSGGSSDGSGDPGGTSDETSDDGSSGDGSTSGGGSKGASGGTTDSDSDGGESGSPGGIISGTGGDIGIESDSPEAESTLG